MLNAIVSKSENATDRGALCLAELSTVENLTISEFARWARCGRTKAFAEIKSGRLRTILVAGRRLVRLQDARAWRDGYEQAA